MAVEVVDVTGDVVAEVVMAEDVVVEDVVAA